MRMITIVTLALLAAGLGVAQENLVPSGDFEQGVTEGWLTDVIVGPVEFSVNGDIVHGGGGALLLVTGQNGRGIVRSPGFAVEAGQQYRISVWAAAAEAPADMVYARVHWWAGEPGVASSEKIKDDTPHVGGTFDWTELTATVTAPADAQTATVRLETGGDTGVLNTETEGPFWVRFDDLSVVPVE